MPRTDFEPPSSIQNVPGFGNTYSHVPNVYVSPVYSTITIPDLNNLPVIKPTDVIAVDDGSTTYKLNLTQLAQYLNVMSVGIAPVVAKDMDYQVTLNDVTVIAIASDITFTLPDISAVPVGKIYYFKADYQSSNIDIVPTDGTPIDILPSYTINALDTLAIASAGAYWFIVSVYDTASQISILTAYVVDEIDGYPASGILIQPYNFTNNGILLGNDGNVYYVPLNLDHVVPIGVNYFNVTIANAIYPSLGMLILPDDAVSGDLGILIGNDGNIYYIIYNGDVFAEQDPNIINVQASLLYPTSGTYVTRTFPPPGSAGLLYGNNGIIYNIPV